MNDQTTNGRALRLKKTRLATALGLLLCASLIGAASLQARPHGDWAHDQGMDGKTPIERMTEQFDLTPSQQERIAAILENTREEQARLRQANRERIDAVLTDEQKARREVLMRERLDRRLERMTSRLDLTSEQSASIKVIFEERMKNPELSPGVVRERIAGILTAEQRAAFERKPERGQRPNRRDDRDGADGDLNRDG